jgi:spoIIIJ-associated protein
MEDVKEFEGKTVDEAIAKACEFFGVPREKLSIDIISEGSGGFLGLGSRRARIRAALLNLDFNDTLVEVKKAKKEADTSSEGDDYALKAKALLEGLLSRMYIPVDIELREEAERIILNVRGDGSGLLIGKKGQNLDAIQHIVSKAMSRQGNGKKMIVVDVESYRKRREEALVNLAHRLAQEVKKTKKKVTLGNMNAHDRRIIHLALQGDSTLITKSRGEGEMRKIVIMPISRSADKGDAKKESPQK